MSSSSNKSFRLFRTIGARLTIWWTAITLGTCVTLCILLYAGLSLSLRHEVDAFLEGEVQEFEAILRQEHGRAFAEIEGDLRHELGSRLRQDLSFRLLDPEGKLVISSDSEDRLAGQDTQIVRRNGEPVGVKFRTIDLADGSSRVRVCGQWFELPGKGLFEMQATYRLDRMAASLAGFRRVCYAVLGVAVVLSALCGLLLARKSLRPIREMIESTKRIQGPSIARRIPRSGTGDELDDLAAVLNEMLERLERQFLEIQRFTADAAHELRTPLAALRGSIEVALQQRAQPDHLLELLEEGLDQFDRLARITDDLLLLARADAGRGFLRTERLVLTDAVQDVVDLFTASAQENGIDLSLEAGQPIEVIADETRLRQVLSNLLDNAIKYTPPGGTVRVAVNKENGTVQLTVTDSGSGIDPEHLPHVFDRFYRVDAARSRQTGGCGLGLAICRSIVEAHSGTIVVMSQLDAGTTATVTLPHTT